MGYSFFVSILNNAFDLLGPRFYIKMHGLAFTSDVTDRIPNPDVRA
jgi:hypothetical protein